MKYIVTVDDLVSLGCSEEDAECWMIARGRHKLTTAALRAVQREASKAGMTLEQAVRMAAEKGWRGFNAEWARNAQGQMGFVERHTDTSWRRGLQ